MMSVHHVSLFPLLPLLFLQLPCESVIYHCFFFFLFLCPSCSHHVILSYVIVSYSSSALLAIMMSVRHVSLFLLLPMVFLQRPCDSVIYHCFFFFLCSSCSHHVSPSYVIVSSSSSPLPVVMMSVRHVSLFPLLPLLFL